MLEEAPESALVRVAADTRYSLFVNGTFVGSGPIKGSQKKYFYDSFEVGALLRRGDNFIAAEVHSPGRPTFSAIPVVPALFVELEGIVGTDKAWEMLPDPTRRIMPPLYSPQLGFAEWRDMRCEPVGWQIFADRHPGWMPAAVMAGSPGGRALVARDIPDLLRDMHSPARMVSCGTVPEATGPIEDDPLFADHMQAEAHIPRTGGAEFQQGSLTFSPTETGSAYAIFDSGRESFGTVHIDVEATEGTILDLGYGDALYDDDRVKTFFHEYRFADRYILRGGRQLIEHHLHDRGFRFLQVVARRFHSPVRIHSLQIAARAYPLPVRAEFHCSDPFLNLLWEKCADTLSVCSTDTFIDSWREQALWLNDTLVVFPFYFAFTGDKGLPARCLRLSADGQRANGLIPSVYPAAEVRDSTFPSMPAIWTIMLADYYLYTADSDLVRELLPVAERALSLYEIWAGPDDLIPNQPGMWNFIEWNSPGVRDEWNWPGKQTDGAPRPPGTTAILNVMIAAGFKAAAALYEAVGNAEKSAAMKKKSRLLMDAVIERFWVHSQGRFCVGTEYAESFSQHPHAFALHYGLLDEPYRQAAVEALLDPSLIPTDFYFQHFVINALSACGKESEALASMRRSWHENVVSDSPTIWESITGKLKYGVGLGALCHSFSCTPLYFLQATILGVRPLKPGFEEFALDPNSLGLESCSGTVPTPHGLIRIEWKQEPDGLLRLKVVVPSGTTGILPDGRRLAPGNHEIVCSET